MPRDPRPESEEPPSSGAAGAGPKRVRRKFPQTAQQRLTVELLERKIRGSGRTLQDVSLALGWPKDGLSRRMSAYKHFTVDDLYEVLAAVGISASAFFEELDQMRPVRRDVLAEILPKEPVTAEEMYAALDRMKAELLAIFREQGKIPPGAEKPAAPPPPAERESTSAPSPADEASPPSAGSGPPKNHSSGS